ncbi:MAG: tetratricopeptide repeat protein, partial [Candidatus Sericytochromatia bacterium]|nr:tetratricopeptide repeat protein [Candidatus Sericytochromatia bacterium]
MSVRGVVLLFIAAAVAVHLGGSVPYVPDPFSLYLRKLIPPSGRPFRVTACGAEMNARDALDRGDHAAAVQELARLILLAPGAIEPRRALASVYLSEQEFEPSLQQFRWLLARATPYGDEVLFQLTWAHQGLGQTQEALKFSQELVERCPQWSAAWVRRGLLLASDDPKASREAFFQALSCPFPDPEGLLEIGNYFLEQGAPRDSLPFFERCLSFPLQGSFAANNLGNAHKSLKDSSRARHYYEMAIGLNSKNPNPHNGLGVIAEEEGQLEKALGLYRRAMAADPSYL